MDTCTWTSVDGWGCNYALGHVGWHERHRRPADEPIAYVWNGEIRIEHYHTIDGQLVGHTTTAPLAGPNESALIAERAQPGDTCSHAVNSDCPHYS